MQITELSDHRLVLEDHSWRAAGLLVAAALFISGWSWFVQGRWEPILGAVFLLVMAWIANYRATTVLDRLHNTVTHELRRVGRATHRRHYVRDIVNAGLRIPPLSRTSMQYHIELTTRDGDRFWLSPGSNRNREQLEALVAEIRAFLSLGGRMTRAEEVRAMVEAGDPIGAVKLIRMEEGLSIEDAKRKVDEIVGPEAEESDLDDLVRRGHLLKAVRRLERDEGLTRRESRKRVHAMRRALRAAR